MTTDKDICICDVDPPGNAPVTFRSELQTLINRCSMENGSDTPDWILANYLVDCLKAFDRATKSRMAFYVPADE